MGGTGVLRRRGALCASLPHHLHTLSAEEPVAEAGMADAVNTVDIYSYHIFAKSASSCSFRDSIISTYHLLGEKNIVDTDTFVYCATIAVI